MVAGRGRRRGVHSAALAGAGDVALCRELLYPPDKGLCWLEAMSSPVERRERERETGERPGCLAAQLQDKLC